MLKQFYIVGDIDSYLLENFQKQVNKWMGNLDDKEILKVNIMLTSSGGDIYSAFGLIDLFRILRIKDVIINVTVLGLAASAGALVALSVPGIRYMTKNSTFQFHKIESWDYCEHENKVELKRLESIITEIILNKTAVPENLVQEFLSKETYLGSEICKKYAIIDEII